jgi:hypothetical protein
MTPAQIRAAIAASPELIALAQAGNTQAIADALSEGRTKPLEIEAWKAARYFIKRNKWQGILAVADNAQHPARAAAQAARDLTSVAGMLVDLADPDPATTAMWAGLIAAGLCTAEDRDTLQGWCRQPDPVPEFDVRRAIFGDDGMLLV